MRKVLVITYYWPPSGGAGVQRWLKFVKYLRDFGWEPVIYTPENPEAPAIDYSLQKDIPENLTVIKRRIWEPYSLYKRITGLKQDEKIKAGFLSEKKKPSFAENLAVRIRGNLFIPDARKFWIKPSVKFLTEYLKENPVDAIVSTGPPHSMHMIALGIKKRLNIPWLADFRDPWTNIDFYGELKLLKVADKKHHQMEKSVLIKSDAVSVISRTMAIDFNRLVNRQYEVITNGFDEDDIISFPENEKDEKFSIVHIGSMNHARNPIVLWRALSELLKENVELKNDIEIKLVGPVDISVKGFIEKYKLDDFVTYIEYLPHNESVILQKKAQVLLLVINNTPNANMVVTGKLFEYIASGTPILCIGPENGDAAEIIRNTETGLISGFDDVEKMKINIFEYYYKFKDGSLDTKSAGLMNFSRKNLTKKIVGLLDRIAK